MAEVEHTRSRQNRRPAPSRRHRTPEERSQERRRRRIEMGRNGIPATFPDAANGVVSWKSLSGCLVLGERSTRLRGGSAGRNCPQPSGGRFSWSPRVGGLVVPNQGASFCGVPVVGVVAVAGRQREMEDAVTVKNGLCSPVINGCRPVHFFGVFDGHGGYHFSKLCKEKMHEILEEELTQVHNNAPPPSNGTSSFRLAPPMGDESVLQETWRGVFTRTYIRTELVAMTTCGCGSKGLQCGCDRTAAYYSGSTAVVVVLTDGHIAVANCGDSRAVLCRGGRVIPLSFDHKPNRADERKRIESCGGHVLTIDTPRVEGILAMSRAIGDNYLKPSVTSEPEVTFTRRNEEDEFVILASDGLWDVMSSEMACRVTRECLREPVGPDATGFPSPSTSAANLLTRLALARGSCDNVSVVVVDLMGDA